MMKFNSENVLYMNGISEYPNRSWCIYKTVTDDE
jgi:hypothetical protein